MAERRRSYTEEDSLADLAATEVGPRTARVMTWLFVALVVGVPLLQAGVEVGRKQVPQVLDVFRPLRDAAARAAAGQGRAAWSSARPVLSAQYLHTYEDDLQRASVLRRFVQPRLQSLLSAAGGFGNNDCVVGRQGWLFYQPGIDYVDGPDVLTGSFLRSRAKKLADRQGDADPQPDPRPAILRLQDDCRTAGVHLVLVPTPDKAMLQPAQLTRRFRGDGPLAAPNNRGFGRLLTELRDYGVDVFDPAPASVLAAEERYLAQDTHWTPAYMEEVARNLAAHVRERVALPPPPKVWLPVVVEKQVSRLGDLVDMLRLPPGQSAFAPQAVTVRQVVDATADRLWQPDPDGDVLVLGDSFTNIYSDGEGRQGLGWGRSAGFAAQLAVALERPVDVIARNGAGATQTRAELARRPDPLGGKRVLVWQFAERELASADWKPIPLRAHAPDAAGAGGPGADTDRVTVEATVLATSRVPAPFSVPYKDCLTFIKVRIDRVESGACRHDQIIAAFWGLKDDRTQPAAGYAPGDRFRLTLVPLARAAERLRVVRYADDLNDYDHPTYFVEEEQKR
jgi:alginate O-acetyltransferase complex protein AlgJ